MTHNRLNLSKEVLKTAKGRLFIGLLACFMVFFAGVMVANAATIYVHPTEGAYHTIGAAVQAAVIGDTILVAPGNYESFTVNKEVHIISEAGPEVTKITSGGQFVFGNSGDRSSISGFTISIPGESGIYVNSGCDYVLIENNIISGCGLHGIYIHAHEGYIQYSTVANNTISHNGGNGIYLHSYQHTMSAGFDKLQIINNIITSNTYYGINFHCQGGTLKTHNFSNNNLWNNKLGNTDNVTVSTNAGNLFIEPFFVNPDTADFHLRSESLCIDAGMVSSIYNDPDGTRNDMGVYGGPGAASFWPEPAGGPVVTELLVTPPSVPVGGTLTLKATGKIR